MKTIKILLTSLIMMFVFTLGATRVTESAPPSAEVVKQCGVSEAQIIAHLQGAPHYHTVYWVQDIPGTCNSKAGVGGCTVATVYVSEGIVTGHTDAGIGCD